MEKNFRKFLNIILVILIVATIIFLSVWGYSEYSQYMIASEAEKVIEEFDKEIAEVVILNENNQEEVSIKEEIEENMEENMEENNKPSSTIKNTSTNKNNSSSSTTYQRKKYKGFYMAGYIQIPRTKIKLPVLESVSAKALNVAVGILMGPGLNKVGNTTIIGHNLHNSSLFSRNNLIQIGDPIYITDEYGNKVTYYVYDKYITDADDASYMTRDTHGTMEISLACCTNDNVDRLIIWARAE